MGHNARRRRNYLTTYKAISFSFSKQSISRGNASLVNGPHDYSVVTDVVCSNSKSLGSQRQRSSSFSLISGITGGLKLAFAVLALLIGFFSKSPAA